MRLDPTAGCECGANRMKGGVSGTEQNLSSSSPGMDGLKRRRELKRLEKGSLGTEWCQGGDTVEVMSIWLSIHILYIYTHLFYFLPIKNYVFFSQTLSVERLPKCCSASTKKVWGISFALQTEGICNRNVYTTTQLHVPHEL